MSEISTAFSFYLEGTSCGVHFFGPPKEKAPLFIMPVFDDVPDLIAAQHKRLDSIVEAEKTPFTLAVFGVRDWMNDLSPWHVPAANRNGDDFTGGAEETLGWVLGSLLPAIEERYPCVIDGARGLVGYSMSGLFALWSVYQTDMFDFCASCSGSLWYEGFAEYAEQNKPQSKYIYLSLGAKEEKTRNPVFARVGNATRRISTALASSPEVVESELVLHPGGHTGSASERLAAANLWMARRASD